MASPPLSPAADRCQIAAFFCYIYRASHVIDRAADRYFLFEALEAPAEISIFSSLLADISSSEFSFCSSSFSAFDYRVFFYARPDLGFSLSASSIFSTSRYEALPSFRLRYFCGTASPRFLSRFISSYHCTPSMR